MCAGSIHTPQIMQLSGFGPKEQLQKMGIEVKADLPGVGQNMVVSHCFQFSPLLPKASQALPVSS